MNTVYTISDRKLLLLMTNHNQLSLICINPHFTIPLLLDRDSVLDFLLLLYCATTNNFLMQMLPVFKLVKTFRKHDIIRPINN